MRKFINKDELEKVKSLDALTYFKNYRPEEIKKHSRNDYILIDHDSLHFSNGKWYWWSQHVGGTSALDYLQRVEGVPFVQACDYLLNLMGESEPVKVFQTPQKNTPFRLPEPDSNNDLALSYLVNKRMIDKEVVDYFIENKQIYQDKKFKNVVFVGYDNGKPKYAFKRSITQSFKGDAYGSDKAFSFSFTNKGSNALRVFEAAIDMLSFMTMKKLSGNDFKDENCLSLAGASNQIHAKDEADLPIALKSFLNRNKQIEVVYLHLDNDEVGRGASKKLEEILSKEYICFDMYPKEYKDVNEELIQHLLQNKEFPNE